jgi:putative MATE family efflux protein
MIFRKTKKDNRKLMLEGNILKAIIIISFPIVLTYLLQSLYQITDTFWVGRLGANAVAAVSMSFPILFFLVSFVIGLTAAGTILIAQYNGKGNKEKRNMVFSQTLSLSVIFSIVFTIIGLIGSRFFIGLMTKDPLVFSQAVGYLNISFLGLIFAFIYNTVQSSLRGLGEVKFPMYVILFTVTLNFLLDPLFMFGFGPFKGLGINGVAWATFTTQALSAFIGLFFLIKGKYDLKLKLKELIPSRKWFKKLFLLGFPVSIEQSSRAFVNIIMMGTVAAFGTIYLASFGIGSRIIMLVIIPSMAISMGISTLVGNNLGAKQVHRAEQITNKGGLLSFGLLTIVGILILIFAKAIVGFFIPGEIEVIAEAARFLTCIALTFGLIGVQMVLIGTIRGAGKTTLAMFLSLIQIFTTLLMALLFSQVFKMGISGIWLAYPVSNLVGVLAAFIAYRKGTWKHTHLIEHKKD